eukprot:Gb_06735 [translate_table: standard]
MSVEPVSSNSYGQLDAQIAQLMQCKPLLEQEHSRPLASVLQQWFGDVGHYAAKLIGVVVRSSILLQSYLETYYWALHQQRAVLGYSRRGPYHLGSLAYLGPLFKGHFALASI